MAFKILSKPARNYGGEPVAAFKAYTLADNLIGEVFIPTPMIEKLGWDIGTHFDIAQGDGEDEGWFALIPMDRPAKAKLRRSTTGLYSYRERTLALGLTNPIPRADVAARVEDGQFLFMRPNG